MPVEGHLGGDRHPLLPQKRRSGGAARAKELDGFNLETPARFYRNLRHVQSAPTQAEEAWFKQEHPRLLKTMADAVQADTLNCEKAVVGASKKRAKSATGRDPRGGGGNGGRGRNRPRGSGTIGSRAGGAASNNSKKAEAVVAVLA